MPSSTLSRAGSSTPTKRKSQITSVSSVIDFSKRRKKGRTQRSVWNSTDDWAKLVADSTLSTSSISSRPPRPNGLPSLTKCASQAAARGFKILWEDEPSGKSWKDLWQWVPDHLRLAVRNGVFEFWGSYLTDTIIREQFIIPPECCLPGTLLPSVLNTTRLKTLYPPDPIRDSITSVIIRDLRTVPDVAVAGMIWHLPRLETVDLGGCALVGVKTVDALLRQCERITSLDLKGTNVVEEELEKLLDTFGEKLEMLKVDRCQIAVGSDKLDTTFENGPFERLEHLCLPGNTVHSTPSTTDFRVKALRMGQTLAHPPPKPARPNSKLQFSQLHQLFPSLTHLELPGLLIPPDVRFDLPPNTLVQFSTGKGGPPVPADVLSDLFANQWDSIKIIELGHVLPTKFGEEYNSFATLGRALLKCHKVERFSLETDEQYSKDPLCDKAMSACSNLMYENALRGPWRTSLRYLSLRLPQPIFGTDFLPEDGFYNDISSIPVLEELHLASAIIDEPDTFAEALAHFANLRTLDISNTVITDEQVYKILDGCHNLSTIDLTSCRGVNVRHRRNIFKAWAEARQ